MSGVSPGTPCPHPSTVAELVAAFARSPTNDGLWRLHQAASLGADISAAAPVLERWLADPGARAHAGSFAQALVGICRNGARWTELARLVAHPRVEVRRCALRMAGTALGDPATLVLVPGLAAALVDPDDECRHLAAAAMEEVFKTHHSGARLASEAAAACGTARPRIERTLAQIARTTDCEVCREFGATLSVNTEQSMPPAPRALVAVAWCKGYCSSGEGWSACPRCANLYFHRVEESFTGSGSNDNEGFFRLDRCEAAMLEPLLSPATTREEAPVRERALGEVISILERASYRGFGRRLLLAALMQARGVLPEGARRDALEVRIRAFAGQSDENQRAVADAGFAMPDG